MSSAERLEFFKHYKGTICLYAILATASFNFLVFLLTVRNFFALVLQGIVTLTTFGKVILFPIYLMLNYWYVVTPILVLLFLRVSRWYLGKLQNALRLKNGRLFHYPYIPIIALLLSISLYMGLIGGIMSYVQQDFAPAGNLNEFVGQFIERVDMGKEPIERKSWFF